jgi:8-oxo-dGTP diphosphatase
MRVVPKAFAYITRGTELLVFAYVDMPEAGIQVPAGTIEPDEPPERAVLREAIEETGLTENHLSLCCFLGEYQIDMRRYDKDEVHHRYVYHLTVTGDAPDCWQHDETNPSDGTASSYRFSFYWADLHDGNPPLIAEHGRLLRALINHLDSGAGDTGPLSSARR